MIVFQCSRFSVVQTGLCVTMDAVTLAAAAVAIAIENSRNAALEDCLLDRERAAMRAADLESQLAQRTFSRPLPPQRDLLLLLHREQLMAAWAADSDNSDTEPEVQMERVQRCCRCRSHRRLELVLPTGRWANLPIEERTFCEHCIAWLDR